MPKKKRSKSGVPTEPWDVRYFKRHKQDDPQQREPAREFRASCPPSVRAEIDATLKAVADTPPPMFSGGFKWRAMHSDMTGWFEVRVRAGHMLYRVFCLLEREAPGLRSPSVIAITGMAKPNETSFTNANYRKVRELGEEYRRRSPRSVI